MATKVLLVVGPVVGAVFEGDLGVDSDERMAGGEF